MAAHLVHFRTAMEFFRSLFARLRSWRLPGRRGPAASLPPLTAVPELTIHREVSRNGVRVFSLCGKCGARLEASATLCEECARSRI